MAADIMQPLTGSDDRLSSQTKAGYIRPNDRLTSLARLEIYSRSYWYRLIDSMYEDYPGLRAVLGARAFDRLVRTYLADCPSRSFTMRDLGSRLEAWLGANPKQAGTRFKMALDMARLEWAHIEAWDSAAVEPLGMTDLAGLNGDSRIGLQPYIRLLELQFPVDDVRLRFNATAGEQGNSRPIAIRRPKPRFLAIHRSNLSVFYKNMSLPEFRVLQAIRNGQTISNAIGTAITQASSNCAVTEKDIEIWFCAWAELGWLCFPKKSARLLGYFPSKR
jgi:hypothetical protein